MTQATNVVFATCPIYCRIAEPGYGLGVSGKIFEVSPTRYIRASIRLCPSVAISCPEATSALSCRI